MTRSCVYATLQPQITVHVYACVCDVCFSFQQLSLSDSSFSRLDTNSQRKINVHYVEIQYSDVVDKPFNVSLEVK